MWPKTEKDGPRDTEERILDHRTVHRFLRAEDEAKIRGRKPPTWVKSGTLTSAAPTGSSTSARRTATGSAAGRMRKANSTDTMTSDMTDEEIAWAGVRRSGRARRVSARAAGLP